MEARPIHRLGLFSISGIPDEAQLELGMARLRRWGYELVFPRPKSGHKRFYFAEDGERARLFNELLQDDSLDALMAIKGGCGSMRILDLLNWELLASRNIPVIGYSDVTGLQLAAYSRGIGCCIHGPMVCSSFGHAETGQDKLDYMLESLRACLNGETCRIPWENALKCLVPGFARAPIIPCNLSLLSSLCGTAYMPDLSGCILALEDVCEPAHRIDRMLTQLRLCGSLDDLAGLVFGQFSNCEDDEFLLEIFRDFAQCIHGPVASGLPFGHDCPSVSIRVGGTFELRL